MVKNLLSLLFAFMGLLAWSQSINHTLELPPYRKYTGKDFKSSSQIWASIQADDGLLFCASNSGLLEFDGEHWRSLNQLVIQGFTKTEDGTIYAGGYGDIGYLERNEIGLMEYVSLADKVPEGAEVILVRDVNHIGSKVYFVSHENVFIYDIVLDEIEVLRSEHRLYPSFVFEGDLIVNVQGKGLYIAKDDGLKPFAQSEFWANLDIGKFVSLGGDFLTLSSKSGAYFYSEEEVTKLPSFEHPYIQNNTLFYATRLSTGEFALGFLSGGFVITDEHFHPKMIFDQSTGVNNQVHHVYEDDQGDLWVSTNDGLVYINHTSTMGKISMGQGLDGAVVYNAVRDSDVWYVTGYSGTFYRPDPATMDIYDPVQRTFQKIENSEIGGTTLIKSDGPLFSIHSRKKGEIINKQFVPKLENKNTYHARGVLIPKENLIVTTRVNGHELEIFKLINGHWQHFHSIEDERLPSVLFAYLLYDETNDCFWGVTNAGAPYRFWLSKSRLEVVNVESLGESSGLFESAFSCFWLNNRIYYSTPEGLFFYENESQKIVRDERFDLLYEQSAPLLLLQTNDTTVWFITVDFKLAKYALTKNGPEVDFESFAPVGAGAIVDYITGLGNEKLAIGSLDGIHVINTQKTEQLEFSHQPIIRSVSTIQGDSLLMAGIHFESEGSRDVMQIQNDFNSISFKYATPFFKGISEVQYRTKMEGFDDEWSDWSEKTQKDFTNLPHGDFAFSVQAKNVFGRTSEVTSYSFTISPPWYLSWWFYLVYFLLFLLLIRVLLYFNSKRLIAKNEKLEATIRERVAEIEKQKSTIEKSLAERESLLKEIHHRVKNNLQIIASLLYLQSGKFQDEDFKKVLEEGQGRVRSMALIHQKLYENDDLKSIPFGEYLQELLAEIKASFGQGASRVKLDIDADDIRFDVETAIPLGLIANELATNAFKYAFDGLESGTFSISLKKVGEAFLFRVSDDGRGIPEGIDIKKTKSLGLRLVKMLSVQLEGEYGFKSDNGTEFQLKFAA